MSTKSRLWVSAAVALLLVPRADAALFDRGGGLIYDTDLNITWLQDTSLSGWKDTWDDALAWADGLVYQGYDDWRLPASPATAQGWFEEGELGRLYYTTLGGLPHGPRTNDGPFLNLGVTNQAFWLDAEPLGETAAWAFHFKRASKTPGTETTKVGRGRSATEIRRRLSFPSSALLHSRPRD
jgi:hypothetical protein